MNPHLLCDDVIEITVYGQPRSQGSKTAGIATRWDAKSGKRVPIYKDGKPITFMKERHDDLLKVWRTSISQRVAEQYDGDVIDGPIFVDLTFFMARPSTHYSQRKGCERELKDSAPLYVEKSPDLDKLARGVMDACKGLLYTDDKFFCLGTIEKVWVDRWERPGVRIRARVPAFRTVGDLRDFEEQQRQPDLLAAVA